MDTPIQQGQGYAPGAVGGGAGARGQPLGHSGGVSTHPVTEQPASGSSGSATVHDPLAGPPAEATGPDWRPEGLPGDALAGKHAVVTGGSRGIGLAVALGLASMGAQVLIVGRQQPTVDDAVAVACERGLMVTGLHTNLADAAAVDDLRAATAAWPGVDIVVASAAVMSAKSSKLVHTDAAHWREVLAANLDGVFHTFAAYVPGMVARRAGVVVALSACLGRMSGPGNAGGLAPYRVSKAGVNALVRNTAAEVGGGRRGVFVDAVCPGHCRTDMGGPDAPRSAEDGARTVLWLANRGGGGAPLDAATGVLWEDERPVPW